MSIHISAKPGQIASTVLLPGDPLRAKYIADNFLKNVKLVSRTRNIYFFTGTYKKTPITVGASGMGCASMGIYSYELFTEYAVDTILRIGTCGAYTKKLALFDLINVRAACSDSTYARYAFGYKEKEFTHHGTAYRTINATAKQLKLAVKNATIHSSDVFYSTLTNPPALLKQYHCLAVEMESFALFANAKKLGKTAGCILTVSDVIPTKEKISSNERENALLPMIRLGLEAAVGFNN
jgi:purine-nucleoside phosphorylase